MTTHRNILHSSIFSIFALASTFTLAGCERKTEAEAGERELDVDNLCTKYETCNDCIAGEQREGKTADEAEAQCTLAVAGCWTTWDKPIVCGEKTYEEKPE